MISWIFYEIHVRFGITLYSKFRLANIVKQLRGRFRSGKTVQKTIHSAVLSDNERRVRIILYVENFTAHSHVSEKVIWLENYKLALLSLYFMYTYLYVGVYTALFGGEQKLIVFVRKRRLDVPLYHVRSIVYTRTVELRLRR